MTLFVIAVAVVLVVYFLYKHNAPKRKGKKGETKVARALKKLENDEYKTLNDLFIRTTNGTSQIDNLVISIFGIFVIETKNYDGWIHGNEKSEYWVQTIYSNKTQFRNPIKQNWSHIYALKEVLSEFRNIKYYPIVVFSGNAELKNVYANVPVIYRDQLKNTIIGLSNKICLTFIQVNEIVEKLTELNIQDRNVKREHLNNVKYQKYKRIKIQRSLKCPKCGGDLVTRNGKYGNFFGCNNYPTCRYTRNY